ncbi:hypothetical protein TIFTF001_031507 [Ficus carica]|uniref:CCHC-type domain-containing protein n=1 Tax=Ficus carica TaxID=3494 RepID=A0AA88J121_FICCA|nr:hypothetical protein TIFTF001_031507 [Ficus carica]
MTVMEVVKKFEQLARLCLELVPNETEKVRRMIKMFRTDIAKQVSADSSPPTLVSDCINQAIRAAYWINQDKEARAQIFKAKKKEKAVAKQSQPRQNPESDMKGQSSNAGKNLRQKKHFGICRSGTNACYNCGKKGHYARNCTMSNQNTNPQFSNRNPNSQLHAAQVKIECPHLAQERLEAPEPQTRYYVYTKGDIEAGTSSVATG